MVFAHALESGAMFKMLHLRRARVVELKIARGFSLIELLVTLSIVTAILVIGIPSFQASNQSVRILSEVSDLRSDLEYARTQAQTNGLAVLACPSTNGTTCLNQTAWAGGWIIRFATANCAVNAAYANPLRVRQAFATPKDTPDTATYAPTNANNAVCFNRLGLASPNYTGFFTVQVNAGGTSSSTRRCLAISPTGQISTVTYGTTDGATGVTC
jgi:type IV fimbrial biogenesis protein FimT